MAIGRVRLQGTQQEYSRQTVDAQQFGAGIGQALGQLAGSVEDLALSREAITTAYDERQRGRARNRLDIDVLRHVQEQTRAQAERARKTADPTDFTNISQENLRRANEEFLSQIIDPDLRAEAEEKLQRWENGEVLGALKFQTQLEDSLDRGDLEDTVQRWASDIYAHGKSLAEAQADINTRIDRTGLLADEKAQMKEAAAEMFQEAEWRRSVSEAIRTEQITAVLPPLYRNMLNSIMASESGGKWNVMYGGETFSDMSRHPNIPHTITSGPHEGKVSTAAGAFQMIYSSWVRARDALNLPDFSPNSQIRAALWLAEESYDRKKPLGMTFAEVMARGKMEEILSIKHATSPSDSDHPLYEGWKKMSDEEFLAFMIGEGGVDHLNADPSLWDDERFENIDFQRRLALADEAASDRARENKARGDRMYDDMLARINAGDLMGTAIDDARERGFIDSTRAQTLQTRYEKVQEEMFTLADAVKNLGDPNHVWTDTPDDQKNLNAMFSQGGRQALKDLDTTYVSEGLVPLVQQTGVIPSDAAAMLSRMAGGTDERAVVFALETMSQLEQVAPDSFAVNLKEHSGAMDYYQFAGEYMTPNELVERMRMIKSPEFAAQREILKKDAQKAVTEYTPEKIYRMFDASWKPASGQASILSTTAGIELSRHYAKLYEDNYVIAMGDGDIAEAMTNKQIGRVWGNSEAGGSTTFGKYMPERYPSLIPQAYGLDWLTAQVRQETGLPEDQVFQLIGDVQTKRDVEMGRVPSYTIQYVDENGFLQTVPGTYIPYVDENDQINTRPNALAYRYTPAYDRGLDDFYAEEARRDAELDLRRRKKTKEGNFMRDVFSVFPRVGR